MTFNADNVAEHENLYIPQESSLRISLRGTHQRYILVCLVQQLSSMTKGALAKELAKKFKISLRNAYTHTDIRS